MSDYLSDDEVEHLTKRVRWSAQVKILLAMGKRFDMHPDGQPRVYREQAANDHKKPQPKWDAA